MHFRLMTSSQLGSFLGELDRQASQSSGAILYDPDSADDIDDDDPDDDLDI